MSDLFNVLQFDCNGAGGAVAHEVTLEAAQAILATARAAPVNGQHTRMVLAGRAKPAALKWNSNTPKLPAVPRLTCGAVERTKLLKSLMESGIMSVEA